ncbi:MAG: DUF21 domain-containing protein [Spirochaetaceae bacterium]|nr:MAG: DUF21 domain-containing protein [Spirochaetaceae bacterium]
MIWVGIALCISQSAMLSGLNLAFFSVSRLRLEVEVKKNNADARRVLALRENANFLLVTILWANVAVNVLLALLSDSVLAGVTAFVFSTVLITVVGEILPQAYFSRRALRISALLSPVVRFYQLLLYPVARPTALLLDRLLGPEGICYFKETDIEQLIRLHSKAPESDIGAVEGTGSLNFLQIDDVPVSSEGERIDPDSIIELEFCSGHPVFPSIDPSPSDEFLRRLDASGKKWVILVDSQGEPRLTLNAAGFLRGALFAPRSFNPLRHCHRPIVIRDHRIRLGEVLPRLKVHPERSDDDVIDQDIVLVWSDAKRVITGSDILGRLLRGIARRERPDGEEAAR